MDDNVLVERRHAGRAVAALRAVERKAAWAGLRTRRTRAAARRRAVWAATEVLARKNLAGTAQSGAAAVDAAAEGLVVVERVAAADHYGAEGGTKAVEGEEDAARSGGSGSADAAAAAAAAGVGRGLMEEEEGLVVVVVVVLGEDGLGRAVSWSPSRKDSRAMRSRLSYVSANNCVLVRRTGIRDQSRACPRAITSRQCNPI